MKLGWLCDSILKMAASPSPMSITPAFSPGPWITQGAAVGSLRKCTLDDLYEQCSFHMAEKMPSSVSVGVRPIRSRMRRYSSGVRPCSAASSGVTESSPEITCVSVMTALGGRRRVESSCRLCQIVDKAREQAAPVGAAQGILDVVLGMRHHAEHVAALVDD